MIKKILCIALLACSLSVSALELKDFTVSFRPYGISANEKACNGEHYFQMASRGAKIYKYAYANEKFKELVFDAEALNNCKITDWSGYEMSADESKILLYTDVHSIYRHSFTANYYVYDVAQKTLTKVSEAGGEQNATLSPDGTKVAYVTGNNIYVKHLTDGTTTQVTTDGKKNCIINGVTDWVYEEEFGFINSIKWAPNSATLAFVRFDETEVKMTSMTMYEGDCPTRKEYELYPGSFDFKYPRAGEKNSIVTVWTFSLGEKALKQMVLPITDTHYVPHLDFAPNGMLMVSTLNRTQNDLRIYAVSPTTAQAQEIYSEQSSSWLDSETANEVTYYNDFFVVPSEKSGYMHLYQYDYNGTLLRQLTSGNDNVTAYYGYEPKKKQFYYQRTNGALNRMVECVDTKGKVKPLTDGEGNYSAKFSSDFKYFIRTYSALRVPNQYAIYNATNGKLVRNLQLNEKFAEKYVNDNVPHREFITCESDGYTLNGYIIKPTDFDPNKKYPVIMHQYSGPGSQQVLNRWAMDWQEYAAMQGFIVACFDGRGTGGREKAFQSVVYQKLGQYESIDQIAAAKHMASLPYVDGDHIGIWGWSYGGYEALMAMSTPGSNYACGVAIAPVTSWKYYDTIYAERYMRTPQENPDGYLKGAPLEAVDQLKGKVLIMFGSADDNVHIINSMQYIAKLHGQGTQFDMMIYPNKNHSINGCDIRATLYQKVLNFFTTHLK